MKNIGRKNTQQYIIRQCGLFLMDSLQCRSKWVTFKQTVNLSLCLNQLWTRWKRNANFENPIIHFYNTLLSHDTVMKLSLFDCFPWNCAFRNEFELSQSNNQAERLFYTAVVLYFKTLMMEFKIQRECVKFYIL